MAARKLPGAVLLICLAALSRPVAAEVIQVPADFSTIQVAIDTSEAGDLILVSPGVYNESLILSGKAITLASLFHTTGNRSYIDQTIVDGGNRGFALRIGGQQTYPTIRGFTFRNADDGIRSTKKFAFLDNRVTGMGDGMDHSTGSGGLVRNCIFEGNQDDGIDCDNEVDIVIEYNTIRNNGDDGIEIRLQPYNGPLLNYVIRNNTIHGNDEDGIQLISYETLTDRAFEIEGNLIYNNAMAGIGLMCCENTIENYEGSNLKERVGIFNNTIVGNEYGITGGDSLVILNNILMNTAGIALSGADDGSIAGYNVFFANGAHYSFSNVDFFSTLFADPLLLSNYHLSDGSPAIDRGTTSYVVNGEVVWSKEPHEYSGSAPDLGAKENPPPAFVPGNEPSGAVMFLPPSPNPSRGTTSFRIRLPAAGHVNFVITDVAGRGVRVLTNGAAAGGLHVFSWDGKSGDGRAAPAGIYFARLETSGQPALTRRFVRMQ